MVMIVAPRIQQLGFEEFLGDGTSRLPAKNHDYIHVINRSCDRPSHAPESEEDAPPRPPTPLESRVLARTGLPENSHQLVNRTWLAEWRQNDSRPSSPSSSSSSSSSPDAEEHRRFQYRRGPPPPPPHWEHHGPPPHPHRPPYPPHDRHHGPPPPPPPSHHYGHHWPHHPPPHHPHNHHHHHHHRHHYRGYRSHYGPPPPPPPPPHHHGHRGPPGHHPEPSLNRRNRHGQLEPRQPGHFPPRGHRGNEKDDGHRGHHKHRHFSDHRNYDCDARVAKPRFERE